MRVEYVIRGDIPDVAASWGAAWNGQPVSVIINAGETGGYVLSVSLFGKAPPDELVEQVLLDFGIPGAPEIEAEVPPRGPRYYHADHVLLKPVGWEAAN